jgi:inner membrane protein
MMVTTHLAAGAAAYALGAMAGLFPADAGHLAVSLLASLAPDIDHPQSYLGRRLPFISGPIARVFGHRGITHSLLAVAGCLYLMSRYRVADHWSVAFAFGYLSHLLADFLTHTGIPLLWHWRRRWSLPLLSVRTGGAGEYLWLCVFVAISGYGIAHWAIRFLPPHKFPWIS